MLYSGTDPESYITEHTLVSEENRLQRRGAPRRPWPEEVRHPPATRSEVFISVSESPFTLQNKCFAITLHGDSPELETVHIVHFGCLVDPRQVSEHKPND